MADAETLPPDLFVWLSDYCDGKLSPDDARRLSRLLVESAAARRVYADYMYQHAALLDDHVPVPEFSGIDAVCRPTAPTDRLPRRTLAVVAIAVAAALVLVFLPRGNQPEPAPPNVAHADAPVTASDDVTLLATYGTLWADEDIREGLALPLGRPIKVANGALHLVTNEGTQLLLEGPAELQFNSSLNAELVHGRVSVRVPPAAVGFTIHTAEMVVVDMGTEFGVATGPLGSEVHVFSGRVWVAPAANAVAKELVTGDAATVRFGGSEVEAIPLQPAAFRSRAATVSLPIEATGALIENGHDPNWQIRDPITGGWQAASVVEHPGGGALVSPTLRNTSISRWIRITKTSLPDAAVYPYRTTFNLPAAKPARLTLHVRHAADDLLDQIQLNGKTVWRENERERRQPWANTDRFREVTIEVTAAPGANVLDFLVFNGDSAYPDRAASHTMFRAEIDAFWHRQPLGFSETQ